MLFVSGQTATDAGGAPLHEGDPGSQLALAIENLEAVLRGAGLGWEHLVKTTVYAVDPPSLMPHYGLLGARFAAAGTRAATTLVGVASLAIPGQLVEIEAVAVA